MYKYQKYIIRICQPLNTYAKRNLDDIFIENLLRIYRRKTAKEKLTALFYCLKIIFVTSITLIFTPLALIFLFTKYRFISIDLSQIGSFLYLDAFIKENILYGSLKRYKYIVHAHPSHISNTYLLERYKDHTVQIKRIYQYVLFIPFANNILLVFNTKKFEPINKVTITRTILNKYKENSIQPLISMPNEDIDICKQVLTKLGMKDKNEKFVSIHVRESGFYDKKGSYRDGNIRDYLDGIKYLTSSGYYVIRLGDSRMSQIDDLIKESGGRLIDYANSEYVSEIMDIFLLSECEFMICTNSGPYVIPVLFHKNICKTNYYPLHEALGFIDGDISIFKKIVNIENGKYVPLEKIFNSDLCMPLQYSKHQKLGLKLVENTSDEILCAIKDFISKNEAPDNFIIQKYAFSLIKQGQWHGSYGSQGEYSYSFLKKYLNESYEINKLHLHKNIYLKNNINN